MLTEYGVLQSLRQYSLWAMTALKMHCSTPGEALC
jgi:hypothetical protein